MSRQEWITIALTGCISTLAGILTGLQVNAVFIFVASGAALALLAGLVGQATDQANYAISVILNSSLQIALGLIPVLVLLSFVIGGVHLTLVLSPLLVAALALTAILSTVVIYDGESTWIEGLVLIGLYGIITVSFWWG